MGKESRTTSGSAPFITSCLFIISISRRTTFCRFQLLDGICERRLRANSRTVVCCKRRILIVALEAIDHYCLTDFTLRKQVSFTGTHFRRQSTASVKPSRIFRPDLDAIDPASIMCSFYNHKSGYLSVVQYKNHS